MSGWRFAGWQTLCVHDRASWRRVHHAAFLQPNQTNLVELMMSIAYIVTGTTRGIGKALADRIIAQGDMVYSLSSAADSRTVHHHNVQCDLSDSSTVRKRFDRLFQLLQCDAVQAVVLINNAGVLDPVGPIESAADDQIVRHLLINQAAPAILMSAFIHWTADMMIDRRIVNITSGAARFPYAGVALYCATKSALEMVTMCVAAEQARCANPVVVCAISPGKVETHMQRQIRASDPGTFPAQPDFVAAKRRGQINSTALVAEMILELDLTGQLRNGKIYDLRDAVTHNGRLGISPIKS